MGTFVLAGLAMAQVQSVHAQWDAPPPGTDLAPASVAPLRRAPAEASKPAAAAPVARPRPTPQAGTRFSGTLTAIDRTAMTITVEKSGKSHTYQVTSRTRFFKDNKPAILSDGVIGQPVSGQVKAAKKDKTDLLSATFSGAGTAKAGAQGARK